MAGPLGQRARAAGRGGVAPRARLRTRPPARPGSAAAAPRPRPAPRRRRPGPGPTDRRGAPWAGQARAPPRRCRCCCCWCCCGPSGRGAPSSPSSCPTAPGSASTRTWSGAPGSPWTTRWAAPRRPDGSAAGAGPVPRLWDRGDPGVPLCQRAGRGFALLPRPCARWGPRGERRACCRRLPARGPPEMRGLSLRTEGGPSVSSLARSGLLGDGVGRPRGRRFGRLHFAGHHMCI